MFVSFHALNFVILGARPKYVVIIIYRTERGMMAIHLGVKAIDLFSGTLQGHLVIIFTLTVKATLINVCCQ